MIGRLKGLDSIEIVIYIIIGLGVFMLILLLAADKLAEAGIELPKILG